MVERLLTFLIWQLVGVALGAWLALQGNADTGSWRTACYVLGGLVVSCWIGFLWDLRRAHWLLSWLRRGSVAAEAPVLRGVWGEVVDRSRRCARPTQ